MYRAFFGKLTRAHLVRNYTVFIKTDVFLVIAAFTRFLTLLSHLCLFHIPYALFEIPLNYLIFYRVT